jgi:hypothetical protein
MAANTLGRHLMAIAGVGLVALEPYYSVPIVLGLDQQRGRELSPRFKLLFASIE